MDNYPVITATGYDFVEGYIPFHGSSDSYPVFKIQYKKQQTSSWTSIFVKFDVNPTYFRIDGLDYMEKYNVLAIPIHKGGDFYRNSNPKIANFTTKCNDFSFDLIEVEAVNKNLSIQWKVSESETYPCKRIEYNLEINSAHLSKPIIIVLGKDKTKTVVDNVSLRSGTVRLKSVVPTNQTSWTDPVAFEQRIDVFKLNSLKVLSQTWGSIEFLWYSNEIKYDTLVCQSSVLLCEERKIGELKESVKPGKFKLKGLTPFTRYSCVLQKAKLAASAVTKEDLPSGPPINKADMPIKSVTNTSAVIQWTDASPCESMNGIFEGFYLELWNGDLKVFSSTESQTTFSGEFEDLTPETSYVVKVFFVNTIGNSKQFASIPFKTRSKAPDAVRELVVYKRTRSSLWLRWMPPENDSNIEKYRLALSTSGVPEKVEEFSPVPCVIWPDFVCHNVRGLVPDTQYTATVVARNSKVSYYGPPTSTKAVTRVEEAAAPENVRVVKYTNKSITLAWEIPLMLNSNPPFFVISFDQVDSNSTDEKPTLSSHKDVPINEAQRHYQLEVKELNPATTYEFTVAAGNRGNRATLNASTPPKNPPAPRTPVVQARESAAAPQIIAKGIAKSSLPVNLLSGYLVLLSTNSSTNGARDSTLAETIKEQFGGEFTVVEEFPATLDEETVVLSKKPSRKGKSSRIDNSLLEPGVTYRVAVAALSTYCNAQSATVSPVVTVIG